MTETQYLWIYTLAEICAATSIAALVFGIKWWRLYNRQKRERRLCKLVSRRLLEEMAGMKAQTEDARRLGADPLGVFESLAELLDSGDMAEPEAWKRVIEDFQRMFDGGESKPRVSAEDVDDLCSPLLAEELANRIAALELCESPSEEGLESDIDELMEQYHVSLSSFSANRDDIGALTEKCNELEAANKELRLELEAALKPVPTALLIQTLDAIDKQNIDFKGLVSDAGHHQHALALELAKLAARIHALKVANHEYRKLVQEILLERDSLAEQKQQLLSQVERMNRSYSSLRLEYLRLYRVTH